MSIEIVNASSSTGGQSGKNPVQRFGFRSVGDANA
jgi:hypothetical protein